MQSAGGVGPVEAGALERLAQHADVEARVVGDQHPPLEQLAPARRSTSSGGGAPSTIALRDPGEALDPARERALRPHERVEGLVQLARRRRARRPTSVSSQRSPPSPLVSVSTRHELGAGARGWSSRSTNEPIEPRRPDGCKTLRRGRSRPPARLASLGWPVPATVFACSACGHESPKWHGRCPGCGEWNTMVEEKRAAAPAGRGRTPPGAAAAPSRPVAARATSQAPAVARLAHRHRRVRPRAGRRPRARLARADRRLARDRQVHAHQRRARQPRGRRAARCSTSPARSRPPR